MTTKAELQTQATGVYTQLKTLGASEPEAQLLTAIAGAESGYDSTKLGDQNLVDAKWGPSIGWFQIRTLNAQRGTGGERDLLALQGNTGKQCRSALLIARGVGTYHNWSTYNDGSYGAFIPYAQKAADGVSDENDGSSRSTLGQLGNTVETIGDGATKAVGGVVSGVNSVGEFLGALSSHATWVRVLQVVGGSGLVVIGITMLGHNIAGPAVSAAANLNPVTRAAKTAKDITDAAGGAK